jgi:hypothetical protein
VKKRERASAPGRASARSSRRSKAPRRSVIVSVFLAVVPATISELLEL